MRHIHRLAWVTDPLIILISLAMTPAPVVERRAAVVAQAAKLLDEAQVSYVYGGHQLGDSLACNHCNTCLESKAPAPAQRLQQCPDCNSCSLDCSHFTALVFAQAALPYPYLDTSLMLQLPAKALRRRYQLLDLGTELSRAAPGDLLVYAGHVVLLERVEGVSPGQGDWRGDVVHATGGREIKGPGQGIQRARFADLANFRGPLLRILRHADLSEADAPSPSPQRAPSGRVPFGRLRPVARPSPAP